jgi:hypothetical protein
MVYEKCANRRKEMCAGGVASHGISVTNGLFQSIIVPAAVGEACSFGVRFQLGKASPQEANGFVKRAPSPTL